MAGSRFSQRRSRSSSKWLLPAPPPDNAIAYFKPINHIRLPAVAMYDAVAEKTAQNAINAERRRATIRRGSCFGYHQS